MNEYYRLLDETFEHILRCVNGFLNLPFEVMQKFALQRGQRVANALLASGHPRLHAPPMRIEPIR